MILAAACPWPVHCFVYHHLRRSLWERLFLRDVQITTLPAGDAEVRKQAVANAALRLGAGETVCLFLDESGPNSEQQLEAFRADVGGMLSSVSVPVVPLALTGLNPRRSRWSRRVTLQIGGPLSPSSSPWTLQAHVEALFNRAVADASS